VSRGQGKAATVVLKIGGNAAQEVGLRALGREIATGLGDTRYVVVHGGGKHVTAVSRKLGHEAVIRDGVRQTSEAEMDVVDMVLAGSVSKATVRALCTQGVRAVALSGADAGMVRGRAVAPDTRTGSVVTVDPALIRTLLESGYTPVVNSVATDSDGRGLNINADDIAFAISRALGCDTLVFFSDVPGVL
jgi:acetylglutamate kinase